FAFSPDGKTLAAGYGRWDRHGKLRLWDVAGGRVRAEARTHLGLRSLAYAPDGEALALGDYHGSVTIYPARGAGGPRTWRAHDLRINAMAFAPDGRVVATASWDKTVRLWDASSGEGLATLHGHAEAVKSVAFSPNGTALASADGAEDGTGAPGVVRLWDVPGGRPRATLRGHRGRVWSVAFSPDGTQLASADDDGVVTLWNAPGMSAGR